MRLLPGSILVLAAYALAGCASVPVSATTAPDSPASASAAEGRFEKLELFGPASAPSPPAAEAVPGEVVMPAMDTYTYTCVMHPQIAEHKPGKCPICGMPLVKKPKGKK